MACVRSVIESNKKRFINIGRLIQDDALIKCWSNLMHRILTSVNNCILLVQSS